MCELEIKDIGNNIILITTETQKDLSSMFIRFQEHYESPFPEIQNKVFTLGYLKQLSSERSTRGGTGGFTYISSKYHIGDWNGFNIPGEALNPFIKGLFDPLTDLEKEMVELFRYRTDKFYIIGVHRESGEDWALEHETCHGLFYTHDKYRKAVIEELSKHNIKNLKKMITKWGYAKSVLEDEVHAYVSADYEWLIVERKKDLDKFNIKVYDLEILHKNLRKIRKKFKKDKK